MTTLQGTFRWAGRGRTFGFVTSGDGGEEHFIHVSEFRKIGMRLPEAGDHLTYTTELGPKGLRATAPGYVT